MRWLICALVLVLTLSQPVLPAADIPAAHLPDARTVQRERGGYRYEQAGWVVLHIEGDPYPRGYQHGKLLAVEIGKYVAMLASDRYPKDPVEGWRTIRTLTDALFLRKLDREILEEMKGIADGAAAAGATFQGRKLDLVDIAALNVWQELDTLDSALAATPTGLEGVKLTTPAPVKKDHCSAFAATGPATADGKIVFGHITMFGLHFGPFVNYWIDCKPTKGRRFVMQGFPGAVWSSQDYYQNDAGILLCETTINQTPFDAAGEPLTSRARRAIQYSETIDDVVRVLAAKNNGLYANEWLIGDTKTNEIAMFELGTRRTKLWRSSKDEWFGGTKGVYWGCNNAKDVEVRLEAMPVAMRDLVKNAEWVPGGRDKAWMKWYEKYKGKIDAEAARAAFTSPALALPHSLDAKFTTSDLANDLAAQALYGPPTGRDWKPTRRDRLRFPDIQPLTSHPWTVLTINPPPIEKAALAPAPRERSGG
ncbi:MAG TPA: C45 family autoproteolytic acyltransferase/hydrolase [Gemmata sp.]|nr:C45 family autoproteolytic acyltransferase/hydrolase [Gemmata sp.]